MNPTTANASGTTLKVHEIYPSIQGESTHAGRPCVFVRLTGCPLRCVWCDTPHAFTGGERRSIDEITTLSTRFGLDCVEVTGGEPLAQQGTPELLERLADEFDTVLLETAGSHTIAGLDPRVRVIMDLKAPGSGESGRNRWDNLAHLKAGDELKIVIADRADFDWACEVLRERRIDPRAIPVHLSPVHGVLDPRQLAEWILSERPDVRLHLQLHKFIWGPEARGV